MGSIASRFRTGSLVTIPVTTTPMSPGMEMSLSPSEKAAVDQYNRFVAGNQGSLISLLSSMDSVGQQSVLQAQEQDFNQAVENAKLNPTKITQQDYDTLVAEVGSIQRNPLLSAEDQRNAVSNLLSEAGIFHDPSSLDILGKGSDAGGLISDRIQIVDPTAGGAEDDSAEEVVDISARTTDDLITDTTVSTVDAGLEVGGETVTTEATNYGWVYNSNTDSFDYGYFDEQGNRISTGDSVSRGSVFGTENKTFEEGDTVSLMPRQDGQFYIEHGGTDKYTPKAGQTIKDQQDQDFLDVLNDLIAGTITLGDMQASAKDIYGPGTVAANQAVTNATTMINTGSTNVDDVVASVTNIGGQGNTYTPEDTTVVDDGGLTDSDITDITDSDIMDITDSDITDGDITDGDITDGGTFNGGGLGDGNGNGSGDGAGNGTGGGRDAVILAASQNSNTVEQMFSRELFEPKFRELDNVAKNLGMIQSIAGGFGRIV